MTKSQTSSTPTKDLMVTDEDGGLTPLKPAKLEDKTSRQLLEFVDDLDARRLAERLSDQYLLTRLGLQNFEGPEFREFAETLARYGLTVMRSWCASGRIFGRCEERGYTLRFRRLSKDDVDQLVNDTVGEAVVGFVKNVLIPGKWDATEGASLSTFFIGYCIMEFPNVYRSHFRNEDKERGRRDHDADLDLREDARTDTAHEAVVNLTAEDLIAQEEDVRNQCVMRCLLEERPYEEIGQICQLTVPGVKNRVLRLKKKHQREQDVV